MAKAKKGDTVKVHYTGKLDDGEVFDTSTNSEPVEFKIGEEKIIDGFEQAVLGMQVGESTTVKIPSDKAYGEYKDEMVLEVGRDQLPPDLDPEVGQKLQLTQADDKMIIVTVTEVSESKVTLDANHPLAGKNLNFEIELVEIS